MFIFKYVSDKKIERMFHPLGEQEQSLSKVLL